MKLTIGDWRIDVTASQISRDDQVVRVDARLMRLLTCLAERAGELVTTDELLAEVWGGVIVTQDSVHQAVASLRRLLGDDPKRPTYIATVPRQGYRLIAPVTRSTAAPIAVAPTPASAVAPTASMPADQAKRWRLAALLVTGVALCLAQVTSVDPGAAPAAWQQQSVAVLPFLDLTTESMDQEYFADGLTEELIDDLSRIPGLKVPSATASFFFKGKQMTVANIARDLGVAYVVDGSLRKAGATLRVAARLVRADNGFVVWSGTYDRQSDNVLSIQGDVANEVTRALQATLQGLPAAQESVR
jgi:transcriptional activator of cad operon